VNQPDSHPRPSPGVVALEVEKRIEAAMAALDYGLEGSLTFEDAIERASDLLLVAKGWLVYYKAVTEWDDTAAPSDSDA